MQILAKGDNVRSGTKANVTVTANTGINGLKTKLIYR